MPLKIIKNWKRDGVVLAGEERPVQGLLASSNFFSGILLFLERLQRAPDLTLVPPLAASCCVDACLSAQWYLKWVVHHLVYNPLVGTSPVSA